MFKEDHNLLAILGPTNTGKTYLAFDRLLSYKSGIFGFPLRLLARENYDKARAKHGSQKIALITGEEKILPKDPKYYFCTVESMPLNIDVECVAIDEVQLAADYERGHIFTDRILNLRGIYETIFLGSNTIEKILINLFPKIKIQRRGRFSKLFYQPKNSLSKLKPRTAIIAFNINSIYEIAESVRAHKGGAAVVMGSLSPRTRNAQVEVYEDKKVDFLIATDAIGMGLNLNINHVAFSSLKKFDGRNTRELFTSELGQIAGRAGRYLNDGSFGFLKKAGELDPLRIQSIENHNFEEIKKIYWRNSSINFDSVQSVLNSFKKFPIKSFFIHKKNAEDEVNFKYLSDDREVLYFLNSPSSILLLWNVCQIPDFQKIFNDTYILFLKNIFLTLMQNNNILPEDWLSERILRLDNYVGGIEELSVKIANIRTWTYISNHSQWIKNSDFWQEKTRQIENNLSDHLHISLTNRFIDFSASFFTNILNRGEKIEINVNKDNFINLNGQNYGYINGFNLQLSVPNSDSLFSTIKIKKTIRTMIEEKIKNFLIAPPDSINFGKINNLKLDEKIKIYWGDEPIGKIEKGINIFNPKAEVLNSEYLDSDKKILITKKLQEWLDEKITSTLKSFKDEIDQNITSELRAIIFNLFENLGTMLINNYAVTIKKLKESEKAYISRLGIRVGAKFFFMPILLKKFPMELSALLWKSFNDFNSEYKFPLPVDGRVSFESEIKMPDSYWSAIGYINLDGFVVRVDVFERIFFLARSKIKYGPFIESSDMMNPIGCNSKQLEKILSFCGFDSSTIGDERKIFYLKLRNIRPEKKLINKNKIYKFKKNVKNIIDIKNEKIQINISKNKIKPVQKKQIEIDPNSPFAVLEKLL